VSQKHSRRILTQPAETTWLFLRSAAAHEIGRPLSLHASTPPDLHSNFHAHKQSGDQTVRPENDSFAAPHGTRLGNTES